ncbi:Zinc finger protein plagl1 [Lobulomyces angularis]|nr:Zinc finger protein plagl1 [Lobulomyces angularis]
MRSLSHQSQSINYLNAIEELLNFDNCYGEDIETPFDFSNQLFSYSFKTPLRSLSISSQDSPPLLSSPLSSNADVEFTNQFDFNEYHDNYKFDRMTSLFGNMSNQDIPFDKNMNCLSTTPSNSTNNSTCLLSPKKETSIKELPLSEDNLMPSPVISSTKIPVAGFFEFSLHKSKEKKHKCEYCSRLFLRKHDKLRHVRNHLGIKPFQCQHCKKQFTRSDALTRHCISINL